MGDWDRSTKLVLLEQIRPEQMQAIKEHIDAYDLKNVLEDYLIGIETSSIKKKKKLFGVMGKNCLLLILNLFMKMELF